MSTSRLTAALGLALLPSLAWTQSLVPEALAVDPAGNSVLEAGETVVVAPSWRNVSGATQSFTGAATAFGGPGAPGNPAYSITDAVADYGTVPAATVASCTSTANCYLAGTSIPTVRPASHWDATLHEEISQGQAKDWTLHVGDSFTDVPRNNGFYRFVETMFHRGVTSGCGPAQFCPAGSVTREQMAVFLLVAKEGPAYLPPACGAPLFSDVPAGSPFCRWVEELARRNVTGGCGGGAFCPTDAVTREQMTVFVLRTQDPSSSPPPCTVPPYNDVPITSPFCRWIAEFTNGGGSGGCGNGNYCPLATVTREQMSVFMTVIFGLTLYGI